MTKIDTDSQRKLRQKDHDVHSSLLLKVSGRNYLNTFNCPQTDAIDAHCPSPGSARTPKVRQYCLF